MRGGWKLETSLHILCTSVYLDLHGGFGLLVARAESLTQSLQEMVAQCIVQLPMRERHEGYFGYIKSLLFLQIKHPIWNEVVSTALTCGSIRINCFFFFSPINT